MKLRFLALALGAGALLTAGLSSGNRSLGFRTECHLLRMSFKGQADRCWDDSPIVQAPCNPDFLELARPRRDQGDQRDQRNQLPDESGNPDCSLQPRRH